MGTLHLAKNIGGEQFESSIICGRQSENEGSLVENGKQGTFNVIYIREFVRAIDPIKDLKTFWKLVAIGKKNRYDIIHTHGSKAGIMGRLAAAFCRTPVILYTVHGWGLKAGTIMTRALYRRAEMIAAIFTTRILFQTQSDMQEAQVHGIGNKGKHTLIGNGINLNPFLRYSESISKEIKKKLELTNQKVVGTVGRVSPQKNPKGFIDIARQILKRRGDIRFIFVGGGEMLTAMRELVQSLGLEKSIRFIGPRADVPEIVANFDIFILPSLWEGMPRSVIEAMALAKPVIVNSIGGIEEIVIDGENGYVVSLAQRGVFARKIELLLENPDLCKKMGQAGRSMARKYDFAEVTAKTEALYLDLARKCSIFH